MRLNDVQMLIHVNSLREWLRLIGRISPAVIRDEWCPARSAGILVVGIRTELAIQVFVLGQLVAIQPHTESGPVRYTNRAFLVLELSPFDDVVLEMVIVSISRKPQVWD